MAENIYLRPAPGCLVRDPQSGIPLAGRGEWKPRTSYWLRRLRDADVFEGDPPPADRPWFARGSDAPPCGRCGGWSECRSVDLCAAMQAEGIEADSDTWRSLHHATRVRLAKALPGSFVVPDGKTAVDVADETLEVAFSGRA